MSDILKCPYCGSELQHEHITGIYCCKSSFLSCPVGLGTGAFGTKELWKALVDTRKALDVAVDALKYANKCIKGGSVDWKTEIDRALYKIAALEQKDE